MVSSHFLGSLFDMLNNYKPSILLIVETKVHSNVANIILQKFYLNRMVVAEACEFLGDIWQSV